MIKITLVTLAEYTAKHSLLTEDARNARVEKIENMILCQQDKEVNAIMRIGQLLVEGQSLVTKDYEQWAKSATGFQLAQVYRYISVYLRFVNEPATWSWGVTNLHILRDLSEEQLEEALQFDALNVSTSGKKLRTTGRQWAEFLEGTLSDDERQKLKASKAKAKESPALDDETDSSVTTLANELIESGSFEDSDNPANASFDLPLPVDQTGTIEGDTDRLSRTISELTKRISSLESEKEALSAKVKQKVLIPALPQFSDPCPFLKLGLLAGATSQQVLSNFGVMIKVWTNQTNRKSWNILKEAKRDCLDGIKTKTWDVLKEVK